MTLTQALQKFVNSASGKEKAAKYLDLSRPTIYRKINNLKKVRLFYKFGLKGKETYVFKSFFYIF